MYNAYNYDCVYIPANNPCGNYFVDEGEDCDAGFNGSRCCSSDCKLIGGAVCR
jgi:hypothetical protein